MTIAEELSKRTRERFHLLRGGPGPAQIQIEHPITAQQFIKLLEAVLVNYVAQWEKAVAKETMEGELCCFDHLMSPTQAMKMLEHFRNSVAEKGCVVVDVQTENLTCGIDTNGNPIPVSNNRQSRCKLLLAKILPTQPKAEE